MSDDLKLVKELRDKTGAGFLDCKQALAANEGDLDNAIDYLRKKGLAKASKKSSREANEGAVGFFENDNIPEEPARPAGVQVGNLRLPV